MERRAVKQRALSQAEEALCFRVPMAVEEAAMFRSGETYPVCPKCGVTMAREYQNFCDRCGQRLDWLSFSNALIVTRF